MITADVIISMLKEMYRELISRDKNAISEISDVRLTGSSLVCLLGQSWFT